MNQDELEKYKGWLEDRAKEIEERADKATQIIEKTVWVAKANGLRFALIALETRAYEDYCPERAEG